MIVKRLLNCSGIVLAGCLFASCCTEEPVTRTVRIEGMHCEKCEASIEESIAAMDGVRLCDASFEGGNAVITAENPAVMELAIDRIRMMQFTVSTSEEE